MKPELGRIYAPTWHGTPPHMARRDVPLWWRFLDQRGQDYQGFFYDAALGDGTDPGPDQPEEYRYGFIRLTRLRADAIGVRPEGWTLFEVRPNAGAGAFGALATYQALWEADPPDKRSLRPTLITDVLRPELKPIYARAGITVLEL
jgi:hypothetical protein